MKLSEPFIRRPVATMLVMLAITLFGALAYVNLPVAALPDVDFPTIEISASLPGASAETMASSVATPLEREFSSIDGIASMGSTSSLGSTNITIQFDLRRDLDSAAQDVQAAISRAVQRLPRDMPSAPSYRKVNPADQAVLLLSLSSKTLPLSTVNEFAETRLAQNISQVRGVAQVQIYGSQKFAVRVQADPRRLSTLNIGLDEVASAIQKSNVNVPNGALYGPRKAFAIETNGQLEEAVDYSDLIVTYRDGAPIRVKDLGRAFDSVENDKTIAWRGNPTDLQQSVVLAIQKQPGANTVDVVKETIALLPEFRAEIPEAIDLELLFDRSLSVRESVHDVQLTLGLTLLLVVGVIFIFLRRVTATLIPSLSMPLAILATFGVIYPLGYSLNNLSLMALTLSVGFVVDDAIVVLENIVRHMEMGKPPMQAALDGCSEISFTILSMTISLAAVFVPFLFMGGLLGSLFREFAVTITIAILASGVVSLTLTPMLSARLLTVQDQAQQGRFYLWVERRFDWLLRVYKRMLDAVLDHQPHTMVFSMAILAATVALFIHIPKGFLPTEDTDQLNITTETIEGVSYEIVAKNQEHISEIVRSHPEVEAFMSTAGARGNRGATNQGRMFIRLSPKATRAQSAQQVGAELAQQLARVPGMRAFVSVPPPIRLGSHSTKSEYQLTLQSTQTALLYDSAPLLARELAKSDILIDVTTDVALNNPQIRLDINRDRAAELGVSIARIEDSLYSAYGSRQVSTIFASNNSYPVILELDPRSQQDPSALGQLHVRSDQGALVPISSLAELRESLGPLSVNHAGQLPAATVSFNIKPGHSLSEAVEVVDEVSRKHLPASISRSFQGSAEAYQSSLKGLGMLLLVSVFVIYLVLGILYESVLHPITILSALPFAGFGALVTLLAFGHDLNVYSFVGVILLVGLVKKNGIMMVDFAVEARKHQTLSPRQAIREACVVRFRPIMMTTMSALLGTLPIALGIGAGAESRQPLGLAVVGGLFFSQLLTLLVTPVFYIYMERLREWAARKKPGATAGAQITSS